LNVASFYRFLDLADPGAFRAALLERCRAAGLLGTVLVAREGVNGTLAGSERELRNVLRWIGDRLGLNDLVDVRWTSSEEAPFRKLRVRLKPEIVTLGRPDILPHRQTGRHVPPGEWNALLETPDLLLVDTRNRYEHEVGSFPGAVDPQTDSFRQFPAFAEALAAGGTGRPVAMFCTGGIRCEKAAALMLDWIEVEGGMAWTKVNRPAEIVESLFGLTLEAEEFHMLFYEMNANVKLLPGRQLVPYVTAGVGSTIFQGESEAAFNYGGGVNFFVAKKTAVRWEFRTYRFDSGADNARRTNNNYVFNVGTTFLL
jgi:outer membrane beta-barrel protein